MSDRVPDRMSEYMSGRMPDRMSEYMSDRNSDIMSDRMSEYMSDRTSDRMSEHTSDSLSEYIEYIYVQIYVMVGISRSKVIVIFVNILQFVSKVKTYGLQSTGLNQYRNQLADWYSICDRS